MLEQNKKKFGLGNNVIRIQVTLDSLDSYEFISNSLSNSILVNWIANIEIKNPFIGAPYLIYNDNNNHIPIQVLDYVGDYPPSELLQKAFNVKKDKLLMVHAFKNTQDEYCLLFSFHHILFDGRGSSLLLKHLSGKLEINSKNIREYLPKKRFKKSWYGQIRNMFEVKRLVEKTIKGNTAHFQSLDKQNKDFSILTHKFSTDETTKISENAQKAGARFGTNLYQVACFAHALKPFLPMEKDIWVPIPYDGRKRGNSGPVISNNMTMIFHRLVINESTSISDSIAVLKNQMNDQLKTDLPNKYNQLLDLMRYFPMNFNYWITTKSSKGNIASFLYSSSGESFYDLGKENPYFKDTIIFPPLTFPPGLTVNFMRSNDQLIMNIGGAHRVISKEDLNKFKASVTELLLQNSEKKS